VPAFGHLVRDVIPAAPEPEMGGVDAVGPIAARAIMKDAPALGRSRAVCHLEREAVRQHADAAEPEGPVAAVVPASQPEMTSARPVHLGLETGAVAIIPLHRSRSFGVGGRLLPTARPPFRAWIIARGRPC